jgi:hypothetical protein
VRSERGRETSVLSPLCGEVEQAVDQGADAVSSGHQRCDVGGGEAPACFGWLARQPRNSRVTCGWRNSAGAVGSQTTAVAFRDVGRDRFRSPHHLGGRRASSQASDPPRGTEHIGGQPRRLLPSDQACEVSPHTAARYGRPPNTQKQRERTADRNHAVCPLSPLTSHLSPSHLSILRASYDLPRPRRHDPRPTGSARSHAPLPWR